MCVVMCKASQILTGNSSNSNEPGWVSRVNFSKCTPNGPSVLASASQCYKKYQLIANKSYVHGSGASSVSTNNIFYVYLLLVLSSKTDFQIAIVVLLQLPISHFRIEKRTGTKCVKKLI